MARTAAETGWVEVCSPHFVVISDALPDQALEVAKQFERARAVFAKAFPTMREYPGLPVRVLAARDQASFDALEPAAWQRSGEIAHSGMLLRNADRAYILLRIGAPKANLDHVIYHEYAHLMLQDNFPSIPLWINEGLAEFYSDADLDEKTVQLGLPSQKDLTLLRTQPLMPLRALFTAGASSPYYNEQGKGTIFYAESWALVDYLMFVKSDPATGRGPIDNYLRLTGNGANSVTAAGKAFGGLSRLQERLALFVQRRQFHYYRLTVSTQKADVNVRKLRPADAAAIRGDFLVRVGRDEDARPLLAQALQADPNRPEAQQAMGLIEMHEHHPELAQVWFKKAAGLSQTAYLARYYVALAEMNAPAALENERHITKSINALRGADPNFAPADFALAFFYASHHLKLSDAQQLSARAVELQPHNMDYRVLQTDILLAQNNRAGALQAAQQAISAAENPADQSRAYVLLGTIQANSLAEQKR